MQHDTNNIIIRPDKKKPFVAPEGFGPKKRGKISKKKETLLEILREDFHFDPIKKYLKLFTNAEIVYDDLIDTYLDNEKRGAMPAADLNALGNSTGQMQASLNNIIKFTFPTLKTMEVQGGTGTAPIFLINTGQPIVALPPGQGAIDVTPEVPLIDKPAPDLS